MNGSFLIPEKFKLNGNVIKVVIDDSYCSDDGCYGEADFSQMAITICEKFRGKKLPKNIREQTYYHELVHMILDSLGKNRLKYDEDFVEGFAQRLHEYEKTKQ